MNREAVRSTNIRSIGWEKNILEIEFLSGEIYQCIGVPHEIWEGFQSAESKGKFFYGVIRGQYRVERLFQKVEE